MSLQLAQKVLEHLKETGKAFCFLMTGELISREDCEKVIEKETTLSWN